MSLTIVIPAYNEAHRLPGTLRSLHAFAQRFPHPIEVLVVDDGSQDGTGEAARRGTYAFSLRVMRNDRNRGKGYSVRRGMLEARGDLVFFCDADGSTPFGEIPRFLAELRFYHVVIGSRAKRGARLVKRQPLFRTLGGRLLNLFVQAFLLPGLWDTQCGFKGFRQEAIKPIFSRAEIDGFGFDLEVLYLARRLGFSIKEIPVTWSDDRETKVKPVRDALRMLHDIWLIRRRHGRRG